jgi:carbamoyl-phosphate synthase large subunit
MSAEIVEVTRKICMALEVRGLVNIQYVLTGREVYVIEVNPRASRTVPYISKVTGVPMCDLATRVSLGEKLSDLGYPDKVAKIPPYTAVKVPVFCFEKQPDVDTQLGPEMKSTGEVLVLGKNLREALYKGLIAAGYKMQKSGGVFITVRDTDKNEIADIAKKFSDMGFSIYSTLGTGKVLSKAHKADEENAISLLESGKINYIISTSARGRNPAKDSVKMRRKACLLGIPCLTSIDTADALADSLLSGYSEINTEIVDINHMRIDRQTLRFTKLQSCGNDYIFINCFDTLINSPESLSIFLLDRHFGVGGDGIVLMMRSDIADAKIRMFNRDGSEGEMFGNALRCVAKYLYDGDYIKKSHMTFETGGGIRELDIKTRHGLVHTVRVNMGKAILEPAKIPVNLPGESIIGRMAEIGGSLSDITCVSMGNPHCVVFCADTDALDVGRIGPEYENAPIFPERVNTEFVTVIDQKTLKMRVWERGCGETLACGTGACAAVVAAVLNGHCPQGEDIRVKLLGGELTISYQDGTVYMSGSCETVFEGTVLL